MWVLIGFLLSAPLFAADDVQHLLVLEQYAEAARVLQQKVEGESDPEERELLVQVLARQGRVSEAFSAYMELGEEREALLEEMAWGVIRKANRSTSLLLRAYSLLAAHHSQDMRGVQLVAEALDAPSLPLRSVALQVAAEMPDLCIQEKLVEVLCRERIPSLRRAAMQAAAAAKNRTLIPYLERLLQSSGSDTADVEAAITSWGAIHEKISREDLKRLTKERPTALRKLAARAVLVCDQWEDIALLDPLLSDPSRGVLEEVYHTLGLFALSRPETREHPIYRKILSQSLAADHYLAIHQLWLRAIFSDKEALRQLSHRTAHPQVEVASLAAGALSHFAGIAPQYVEAAMAKAQHPLVQATLAWALLQQGRSSAAFLERIRTVAVEYPGYLEAKSKGSFSWIGQGGMAEQEGLLQSRFLTDQEVRLSLLSGLAIKGDAYAERAIRDYLRQKRWQVGVAASALLLSERAGEARELLASLLCDEERAVRTHAALVLGTLYGDRRAIQELQELYPDADRTTKEAVLLALGRIATPLAKNFLIGRLQEPIPTLRVVAAVALLDSLHKG